MNAAPRPVLIVAHPGHELLLHAWMERERPVVLILTDGSGGSAGPRIDDSRRIVQGAGAAAGPLFGAADDRRFYRAILDGDTAFFEDLVEAASEVIAAARAPVVVSDAVEHFNPVHDLCSALAAAAARRAGCAPGLWSLPIEAPIDAAAPPPGALVWRPTPQEARRKLAAAGR